MIYFQTPKGGYKNIPEGEYFVMQSFGGAVVSFISIIDFDIKNLNKKNDRKRTKNSRIINYYCK